MLHDFRSSRIHETLLFSTIQEYIHIKQHSNHVLPSRTPLLPAIRKRAFFLIASFCVEEFGCSFLRKNSQAALSRLRVRRVDHGLLRGDLGGACVVKSITSVIHQSKSLGWKKGIQIVKL